MRPHLLSAGRGTFRDVLGGLGLLSGVRMILDPWDGRHYPGQSGQIAYDTSGFGVHFNRGSGSGGDGADPTWNGVIGQRSSGGYWSSDGGDYFSLIGANLPWMDNIPKAGAKYTFLAWIYCGSITTKFSIIDTYAAGPVGFGWQVEATGNLQLYVLNTAIIMGATGGPTPPLNSWAMIAVSVDINTGAGFHVKNNTVQTFSASYTSPATSGSGQFQVGGEGGTIPLPNGTRLGPVVCWEPRALTGIELVRIYDATRIVYGA